MKVLLAVSGGIDSMCMADMFCRAGGEYAIAHCNFHLRGAESDADAEFVEKWAETHGVPFFRADFDTAAYASEHGISIEMAARELRYAWFARVAAEEGFDAVAVAHNANDNAETLLLNLLRGTGLRGIIGMKSSGFLPDPDFADIPLLRPLLGMTRADIEAFAAEQGLTWREDSTNASSAYKRNRLRHEVIPVLREMNPSLPDSFRRAMEHIAQVDDIAEDYFLSVRDSVCSGDLVSVKALLALKHARYVLFRLAEPVGLTETALDNLWDLLCSGRHLAGKVFVGKSGEIRGLAKWRLQIVVFDKSC
jgi:tRNA(Ile)-lysidine synthase